MPRRRTRTTNRRPQAERHLRVRGVRRRTPDARKLSRAFIGLALARAQAEAHAQAQAEIQAAAEAAIQPDAHVERDVPADGSPTSQNNPGNAEPQSAGARP